MKVALITILSAVLCLETFTAMAQENNGNAFGFGKKDTSSASVVQSAGASQVIQDPRINLLIQKQVYLNNLALRNLPGYRVQVISTMNRGKAMEVKGRLMQLFPQYQTYLSYLSPYFRVRIGDFRNRNDAVQLQEQLNPYFPQGVFTVRDMIHISPEQLFESNDQNNESDDESNH